MHNEEEVHYLKIQLYRHLMTKFYADTLTDNELRILGNLTIEKCIQDFISNALKELEQSYG